MNIIQTPPAGDNLLKYEGDTITFTIEVPENLQGKAYLRTNLFNSTVRQREIIEHAEYGKAILGRDWHDIEMKKNSNKLYSITLPLVETGYFAAKTLFVCEGEKPLVYWPEGENSKIKVEPAFTVGSNSIYTVFPRQFGLNKQSTQPQDEESIKKLDSNGYTVIPPSGTFRDVISELDHIIYDLGFKILQVLPVHPVPTTYAKMGRFGSPFAAKDFLDVDHGCAEFDKSASPMDQFEELVDAVHLRSGKLFLDLPANHTGWASAMQEHHPEWFERNSDGSFKNPGAWGVIWGDLCELNYDCYELWKYMAEVFIFWCSKGVDGFRCDAGYMIPVDAWRYIVAKVRRQFPHTIFMLEGLGGPIEKTQKLLTHDNLNWAYSELFQNYSQDEITNYCNNSQYTTTKLGTLVNFAETHDNDRLANSNYQYAMLRTAIAALFSQCGAFGITNGVEWFAKEKVDVHGNSSLNWGSQDNQIGHIKKLLQILKVHPCFQAGAEQWFIQTSHNNSLALLRKVENQRCLLIACNLEPDKNNSVEWKAGTFWSDNLIFNDLISDKKITTTQEADRIHLELSPGQVVCLSIDTMDIELEKCQLITGHNNPVLRQVMRSKAMEAWQNIKGFQTCEGVDFNLMADQLSSNPEDFLREMTSKTGYCNYVCWDAPEDANRVFIVPPKHFLLVRADRPFLAEMFLENDITERHYSLPDDTGKHFAIFKPIKGRRLNIEYSLKIRLLSENAEQITAPLLYTRNPRDFKLCLDIPHSKLQTGHDYALCTNKLGGMAQVSARWSEIYSKYDAFLASNLNANYPVDRFVSLVRFRAWIRYRDYSCELNSDCQTFFTTDMDNRVLWSFEAPIGMGKIVPFEIILEFGLNIKS